MRTSTKIKTILVIFFVVIFSIIAARYAIGLHFKKKFSEIPPPGVIVNVVKKSNFFKSIETFGTAIAKNSKTYRVKKNELTKKFDSDGKFVKKGETIIELNNTEKVIADFSGRIGTREIAQGVLGSDSLIITLDDLNEIVIDIKIPENYVGILKKGLKAEITNSAYSKIFDGKIDSVSSRVDPSTRSILARVTAKNLDYQIIPGQLMTVKIIYDKVEQIGVPESVITVQGDTAFVYTVENEIAKKKYIKLGKRNYGKVSILSGVNEGDFVISEGVSKARDNKKVKILNTN